MISVRFLIVPLLFLAAAVIRPATAAELSVEEMMRDAVYGSPDAPLTVVEYASLGCPHCAAFHAETLPEMKKDYIDTGKVRLIYRDFPLGTPALAASMVARCAGPDRYLGMVDIFFKGQRSWSRAENPLEAIKQTARFGGMSSSDVDACLGNQQLLDAIQAVARNAQADHQINSTPSFVIGGKTYAGNLPYDDFKQIFDAALGGN